MFCGVGKTIVYQFIVEWTFFLHFWYNYMLCLSVILFAVPEEVTVPAVVENQGVFVGDSAGEDSSHYSVSGTALSEVNRHSNATCLPPTTVISDSRSYQCPMHSMPHQRISAAHCLMKDTVSATEGQLAHGLTSRRTRLTRKSTRRVRQRIPDTNIGEFDDDNDVVVDDCEEVEFSETDSEPDEDASGSDESDLEFETELAKQMNISQVRLYCLSTVDF